LIGLVIALIYGVFYFIFQNINKRKKALEMQLDILNKEMAYLEADNQNLKKGIFDSAKEEELEKEARMNYGYKKAGETAVILSSTTTEPKSEQVTKSSNLLEKIKI